jgi:hypothetical protein
VCQSVLQSSPVAVERQVQGWGAVVELVAPVIRPLLVAVLTGMAAFASDIFVIVIFAMLLANSAIRQVWSNRTFDTANFAFKIKNVSVVLRHGNSFVSKICLIREISLSNSSAKASTNSTGLC